MVNLIPFVGTPSIKRQIANHYKVVATNIDDTLTGDILSKARVILIGERHGYKTDYHSMAAVINGFRSRNIQLLFEGNRNTEGASYLSKIRDQSLIGQAKSWDLPDVAVTHNAVYSKQLLPLLEIGARLLTYFKEHFEGENPADRLEEFKAVATTWLKKVGRAYKADDSIVENTFFPRNRSLATSLQNAVADGAQKIILVAGSAHITPSIRRKDSVDHVMSELAKMSIPFAILNWKTAVDDEVELKATYRFKNAREAAKVLEGKLFPLEDTNELLKEIEQIFDGGPTSTMQISVLINTLAVAMFAIRRCTDPRFTE